MKPCDEVVRQPGQISVPARLINAHRHLHLRPRRVAFIFLGLFFLHLLALACAPARDWSLDVEHGLEENTLLIGNPHSVPCLSGRRWASTQYRRGHTYTW